GLIGIGLLGTALAERMLAAGLEVVGFDLRPESRDRFKELGGKAAAAAIAVAKACRQIVLCLPDSSAVERVVNDIAPSLEAGTLLVDATTGDPDATVELGTGLRQRGIGYVDATIAGSSEQV